MVLNYIAKQCENNQYKVVLCKNDPSIEDLNLLLLERYKNERDVDGIIRNGNLNGIGINFQLDDYNKDKNGVKYYKLDDNNLVRVNCEKDSKSIDAQIMDTQKIFSDLQNVVDRVYLYNCQHDWLVLATNNEGNISCRYLSDVVKFDYSENLINNYKKFVSNPTSFKIVEYGKFLEEQYKTRSNHMENTSSLSTNKLSKCIIDGNLKLKNSADKALNNIDDLGMSK